MRILVNAKDEKLLYKLKRIEGVSEVWPTANVFDTNSEKSDLLIISDKQIEPEILPKIREFWAEKPVLYLLSNQSDSRITQRAMSICDAHKIDFIPPQNSLIDIIEFVEEFYFNRKKVRTPIMTFVSGLPQQGLTSTLLSIGKKLGQLSNARIGIIGLNGWNSGYDLVDYNGKTLDELWDGLQAQSLRSDELSEKSHCLSGNVRFLAGNRDRKMIYRYNVEGIAYLLQLARQEYDLVLLDCGAYFDTAMAYQGINQSDVLVLHMTGMINHINAFEEQYDQILSRATRISKKQMLLLMNQVREDPGLFKEKQVSETLEIPLWSKIPFDNQFIHRIQKRNLEELGNDYESSIDRTSKLIVNMFKLPLIDSTIKAVPWYKRLGRRAGLST
ncbi:hypothetical protein NW801_21900 [Brevibacillus laterosporus]|uniref:Pilus assembly protein CpaE n=1 Tax=Brevibacillus halotolerans TaxID=1507437 RepID=A0ABT4I2V2_9BACL|nr:MULTISPECIES: hypothetical protein [Brevibacillus]MCR8987646.1 hypothetical protein [Brevibacillus laterosporus]MCZ0833385.1 hypothetical protein [Brevibacillus halotolerans]